MAAYSQLPAWFYLAFFIFLSNIRAQENVIALHASLGCSSNGVQKLWAPTAKSNRSGCVEQLPLPVYSLQVLELAFGCTRMLLDIDDFAGARH